MIFLLTLMCGALVLALLFISWRERTRSGDYCIVDWFSSCGRVYLTVDGVAVALQGTECFDGDVLAAVADEYHEEGKPHLWTSERIKWVAERAARKTGQPLRA